MSEFSFGKFKDRSIQDVFEENPKYIDWVIKQPWFKGKFRGQYQVCIMLLKPIQTTNEDDIIIYTDGGCSRNGSKSAKAGIGVHFSKRNKITFDDVSAPFTDNPTNQRAELSAILRALQIVKELSQKIIIYTDSEYSINCITKWFYEWHKQNKLDKKKNIDLIQPAHLYYRHLRIEFRHINSHTGLQDEHSLGNETADRLATLALS